MGKSKTEYVPVLMEPAELAALRDVATERSCSVGAVVRWAVRKAVIDEPLGNRQGRNEGSTGVLDGHGATPLGIQSQPVR
jgi:hypothetical protein